MSRPEQYTRIPNPYPAPTWMGTGLYWNPEYLQWREAQDALNPVPYRERHFDADEAVRPAREPRFFDYRTCDTCDIAFMPESSRQRTCRPCQKQAVYEATREDVA